MSDALERLRGAGIENPLRELRMLEAHFEGDALDAAIEKRVARRPMSQILGFREFWKDRFIVTEDVLDPRPDSELFLELVDWREPPARILDLGSGSGALGLSALGEAPEAHCVFADISEPALLVAQRNAVALGREGRAQFVTSDWLDAISGEFNLILCNPPYIREDEMQNLAAEVMFEPHLALTPGGDGLEPYRQIAPRLNSILADNGVALFEHGEKQQSEVMAIFEAEGFQTKPYSDINEKPRIVKVMKN